MSMMVGTCSTTTGHSSMQAPQETQSQMACSGMAPSIRGIGLDVFGVPLTLVSDGNHVLFDVLHDVHGGQRFAGNVGRADVGAASANGTGVTVEQFFPGEVLDAGGSETLHVFEVDSGQCPPGFQAAEEGVERSGHHVYVLGEGDIE